LNHEGAEIINENAFMVGRNGEDWEIENVQGVRWLTGSKEVSLVAFLFVTDQG
jgi:hypothetical protein